MKFITNILLKLQMQSDGLASLRPTNKRQFLSWDKIQKIAIIIDNKIPLNKSAIDKFCLESGRFIEIYYIELNAKQVSFNDWQCFTTKQSTIFKLPKKTILVELKKKQFDCVINTCLAENLFSVSIMSAIEAPLKCSDNNDYNQSDLIILKAQNATIINYLNDVLHYLKMIK